MVDIILYIIIKQFLDLDYWSGNSSEEVDWENIDYNWESCSDISELT